MRKKIIIGDLFDDNDVRGEEFFCEIGILFLKGFCLKIGLRCFINNVMVVKVSFYFFFFMFDDV